MILGGDGRTHRKIVAGMLLVLLILGMLLFCFGLIEVGRAVKPDAPNGVGSIAEYEGRIGEAGMLLEDSNIQMWIPARYKEHSQVIFKYLQDGCKVLEEVFGNYTLSVRFSIEHYPEGSQYAWGGTDARGTIRYGYNNLKDDSPEWNNYRVPHVIGYYEEMAHCFLQDIGLPGFYETLGMITSGQVTLCAAWNPYIQKSVDNSWSSFAATTAYYLLHNTGEPGVPENIYLTRILAHIFKVKVVDVSGWESLWETFKLAGEGFPLKLFNPAHSWGGFLGFLGNVTGKDMHSVFGDYGLPVLRWTGETGFEADGFERLNESGWYRFRIKTTDREGSQPSSLRVHLYNQLGSEANSYAMNLIEGNGSYGWIYEKDLEISEPYGWSYVFSAKDGVHPVFQAIGQPSEKTPMGIRRPTSITVRTSSSDVSVKKNLTLSGELSEEQYSLRTIWQIGLDDYSSSEFDGNPRDDPSTVLFNVSDPCSLFPSGIGTDIGPQRSRIVIAFNVSDSCDAVINIRWNPGGSEAVEQFSVSLDEELIGNSDAVKGSEHPYEWRTNTFQKNQLPTGTHQLTLQRLKGDGLNLDYLSLNTYAREHIGSQTIRIQILDLEGWKEIGTTSGLEDGSYIFFWQPTSPGTYVFRSLFEGSTVHGASTSENITVNFFETSKTDINEDLIINILDITMVATLYGTSQGDPNWNATADLDNNGIINILDISMVAKDYGKTI